MLKVKKVNKSFEDNLVLDQISFEVPEGETLAILGPSGCGKSTLLKIIAGLLVPDCGYIEIDNIDITKVPTHKRNVGLVFQDNQLFPHLNVSGNIEFGLKLLGWDKSHRKTKVSELLDLVNLNGFENRQITDLSGGESKRIALARSLATAPKVLLLDEPLTGLDEHLHDQLLVDLKAVLFDSKTTTVLVTHDKSQASELASEILTLK